VGHAARLGDMKKTQNFKRKIWREETTCNILRINKRFGRICCLP